MSHDASKALMGVTGSSEKAVSCEAADPATYVAGLAVRRTSTGALSVSSSDGPCIGVSLGASLSDHAKTSVCRQGKAVPLKLTDIGVQSSLVVGDLTFTAVDKGVAGDDITITLVDDTTAGSETVDVTDTDIVVHMEDEQSTAQQIADAIEASAAASALVTVEIAMGEASTAQDEAAEDNLEGGVDSFAYAVVGAKVRVHNSTGLAIDSSNTLTKAVYATGALKGINLDNSEVDVALIDFTGGL